MLGWISGQDEQFAHSAGDNSKVPDPPETPAPVFAIRAFKSALFGTPGAEAEEESSRRESQSKHQMANQQRGKSDLLRIPPPENAGDGTARKADIDGKNATGSPTKSILVTPGTISNRRKTVTFGDGVVDNERKQDGTETSVSKTPTNQSPNVSSQWTGSSDGKSKPRSKLTQALLDSREKSRSSEPTNRNNNINTSSPSKKMPEPVEEDANDDTINLNEPRSQSGKYWKSEFDSYRTKTNWEIKKLVQYRSVAKAYAKKKDEEALRLTEKLREEEEKVSGMERHVSHLASTMVAEGAHADKEKLVQDLAKQTALALQYKHRVNLLRKSLEQHGVLGDEIDAGDYSEPDGQKQSDDPRKTQEALVRANAIIEELKNRNPDTSLSKLQDLAQNSEKKASELEKENMTLKQTLARVKQEMTKYEGRRKEKEAKLKQREAKLEIRIQEYRERLKAASQQHRESEEIMRESFMEERRRMQDQIDFLNLKVTTIERLPEALGQGRYSYSPRKGYTGVQVYDFGQLSPQREDEETYEIDEPPSPSPRSKDRHARQSRVTEDSLDLRTARAMDVDDDDERLTYMEDSPKKAQAYRSHNLITDHLDALPPSSPPLASSIPTKTHPTKQKYSGDTYLPYEPSQINVNSIARHLSEIDESQQIRQRQPRRRSPTKYSLDALSGLPDSQVSRGKRHSIATVQRDAIPEDRMLAAQARLRRKGENRKGRYEGKENLKANTKVLN